MWLYFMCSYAILFALFHVRHTESCMYLCPFCTYPWVCMCSYIYQRKHTATHCSALQRVATHCNALQHTSTHCNTLQHTATHCNTLQHECIRAVNNMCDRAHSYVWHDSLECVTWLIHVCDMTHSYVWHDSVIHMTWLIHTFDMTHSYVWHDSVIHTTSLIHKSRTCCQHPHVSGFLIVVVEYVLIWELTCCQHPQVHSSLYLYDSYVQYDAFICVTWLTHMSTTKLEFVLVFVNIYMIHMRNITHSYVWHDTLICQHPQMHPGLYLYACMHVHQRGGLCKVLSAGSSLLL